ncbi:hypothetical protein [Sulfuriflexus mobilis]|uniref:hypothetical protein n=1 Tax=Sulfuriflexus mobilis TaxID=1811807 RepID=UPI000F818A16|nr:hypothetical protein [Sulfuriflexus mobilis]
MVRPAPAIGTRYDIAPDDHMEVIAIGTRGIVVEYSDGRVELVAGEHWPLRQREVLRHANTRRGYGASP